LIIIKHISKTTNQFALRNLNKKKTSVVDSYLYFLYRKYWWWYLYL